MIRLASAPPGAFVVRPERVVKWAILGAGLAILLATLMGLTLEVAAIGVLALVAAVAWRWPAATAVFFVVFTPINRFVIALLFLALHSTSLDKFGLLWKDALVAILVLRVLYTALFSTKPIKLRYLDVLVVAFIVLTAIYLIYPGSLHTDLFTRVQGFRTDASFLFAYFIGRAITLERRHVRWMVLGLIPGSILLFAVAMFEFVAPTAAAHYVSMVGISDFETVRDRSISGVDLHRASALMGDLALSFYQMVVVALASALYVQSTGRRRWLSGLFLLMMTATLVATLTRSAIITALVVVALTGLLARRPLQIAIVAVAAGAAGLVAFVVSGIGVDQLQRLLNLEDASTRGHLNALQRSLTLMQGQPLGRGLGTAGTIGQRFVGNLAITNENWYLQLGTEMGVIAAVLYLLIVAMLAVLCFKSYFEVHDFWLKTMALGIGAGAVGFLILGNFLHAWENTVLSMAFWLLAGVVVRARDLETAPEYRDISVAAPESASP